LTRTLKLPTSAIPRVAHLWQSGSVQKRQDDRCVEKFAVRAAKAQGRSQRATRLRPIVAIIGVVAERDER
jgi:hypothetical protein